MVRIIEEREVLAEGRELPTIPADDRYLVELLYAFPEAVLVTTDALLAEQTVALQLRAVLFRDNVADTMEAIERSGG
ncbi:MAG TPA: hypothetical protein VNW97_15590 [Candidatus Saccharimonadales bacterium]|jgi:hypothetical protein|nr:hypothetical protein [Candidatus Saccharimonadales bacterium]